MRKSLYLVLFIISFFMCITSCKKKETLQPTVPNSDTSTWNANIAGTYYFEGEKTELTPLYCYLRNPLPDTTFVIKRVDGYTISFSRFILPYNISYAAYREQSDSTPIVTIKYNPDSCTMNVDFYFGDSTVYWYTDYHYTGKKM